MNPDILRPTINPNEQAMGNPEAMQQPGTPEHVGAATIHGAEPDLHNNMHPEGHPGAGTLPDSMSDSAFGEITAAANGDIRPEDAGRVHDIEAARAEAEQENAIFNAHVEAIAEDKRRAEAAEVAAKQKEEEEAAAKAKTEAEEAATAAAKKTEEAAAAKTAATTPEAEQAAAAAGGDVRAQAAEALKEAGLPAVITSETQVTKEPLGNKLVVTNGDHVQVLTPDVAGVYHATDYNFDRSSNTVSIGGNAFLPADKFTPGEGAQPDSQVVTLPPAVAKAFGFEHVMAAGQPVGPANPEA